MILETFTEFVKISFKRWQFILEVATSLTNKKLAVVNLKKAQQNQQNWMNPWQ